MTEFLGVDLITWRQVSAYVGVPACVLLGFRLVSSWRRITALSHLLGLLVFCYIFLGSFAQARLLQLGAPGNELSVAFAVLNVSVVVAAVVWPRLVDRWPPQIRRTLVREDESR